MGRLDQETIRAHLAALEEAVRVLRRLTGWGAAELQADPVRLWAVAHGVQLALQNVLDVSMHIVAGIGGGTAPEDYRGALVALGRLGVVEQAFAESIAPMAGLRNILVHSYLRLSVDRLVQALARLDDFDAFVRAVAAFLALNPEL